MSGLHRYHTIAFRPTTWERELIEKRCELSGLMKKDFIIGGCSRYQRTDASDYRRSPGNEGCNERCCRTADVRQNLFRR